MVGKFQKLSCRDVPLDGKTVLVRVDYNVPLDSDGEIADDYRIRVSLPTLRYLIRRRCRIVLISHLGRPDGRPDAKYSLEKVAYRLVELLGRPVKFVDEPVGDIVLQASKHLHQGQILLLENLRFHPGETSNDLDFAKRLARDSGADYFIQDGFGVAHRAQASTEAICQLLPSSAGLLLEKEYRALTSVMHQPKTPLVAVIGGAKITDKITVIESFASRADKVLIGGAIANTFLKYSGLSIGKSLYEANLDQTINAIYDAVSKRDQVTDIFDIIKLPVDVAVAKSLDKSTKRRVVPVSQVEKDDYILDIGDETIQQYCQQIEQAKTVVWSGTMGYAEAEAFAHGSARVALAMAQAHSQTSVIGGGDTVDFVIDWSGGDLSNFTHVSSGGSASIELMSGQALPGVESLMDKR